MSKLEGKAAVVTGGIRDPGLATAKAFQFKDSSVVITISYREI